MQNSSPGITVHVPYQASKLKDHEDNPIPDNQVHPKQVLDDQPNAEPNPSSNHVNLPKQQ